MELIFATWSVFWYLYWVVLVTSNRKSVVDASRILAIAFNGWSGAAAITHLLGFTNVGYSVDTVLQVSLGYFLWDLQLCSLFLSEMKWEMWLHAVVCTVGYMLSYMTGVGQNEAVALLAFELSTPFLHLYHLRWGGAQMQVYCLLAFASLFMLVRVFWGTLYLLFWVLPVIQQMPSWTSSILASLVVIGISCLNFSWAWRILGMIQKRRMK